MFDIGVAGPIGGFLVLVPFLVWGVVLSKTFRVDVHSEGIAFGEPLLIKALIRLRFGVIPAGYDVTLHPMGFAAWWGMLATALNLMPFGQLDGGHIVYALLGRRAWYGVGVHADYRRAADRGLAKLDRDDGDDARDGLRHGTASPARHGRARAARQPPAADRRFRARHVRRSASRPCRSTCSSGSRRGSAFGALGALGAEARGDLVDGSTPQGSNAFPHAHASARSQCHVDRIHVDHHLLPQVRSLGERALEGFAHGGPPRALDEELRAVLVLRSSPARAGAGPSTLPCGPC